MNGIRATLSICKKCPHFEPVQEIAHSATCVGYYNTLWIYYCREHAVAQNVFNFEEKRTCIGTSSNSDKVHYGPNPVPNYCPYMLEQLYEAELASESGSVPEMPPIITPEAG